MSLERDAIRTAMAALEAAGTPVSIRRLHQALPGVGRSTIGRHLATLRAEQAAGDVTTAVLEAPDAPHSVPDTRQVITDAEAALEAARAHLETLKRDHAPALRERVFLVSAWQQGVIKRDDPAWAHFDGACAQIQAAEQRITRAEEAVKYATQAHDRSGYEQAAAEVAATSEGQALLAKIEGYQRQYEDAEAKKSPASYSWSIIKHQAQQQYRDLVNIHRGLLVPKVPVTEEQRQSAMTGEVAAMQAANPARDPRHY